MPPASVRDTNVTADVLSVTETPRGAYRSSVKKDSRKAWGTVVSRLMPTTTTAARRSRRRARYQPLIVAAGGDVRGHRRRSSVRRFRSPSNGLRPSACWTVWFRRATLRPRSNRRRLRSARPHAPSAARGNMLAGDCSTSTTSRRSPTIEPRPIYVEGIGRRCAARRRAGVGIRCGEDGIENAIRAGRALRSATATSGDGPPDGPTCRSTTSSRASRPAIAVRLARPRRAIAVAAESRASSISPSIIDRNESSASFARRRPTPLKSSRPCEPWNLLAQLEFAASSRARTIDAVRLVVGGRVRVGVVARLSRSIGSPRELGLLSHRHGSHPVDLGTAHRHARGVLALGVAHRLAATIDRRCSSRCSSRRRMCW